MSQLSAAIGAAGSALNAERTRIEAAVSNMANAESTRGPDGQPYRARRVLLAQDDAPDFNAVMGQASVRGVKITGVVEDQSPLRRRYQPSHPHADGDGFVSLPNVDASEEMVDMLSAARAYQANLAAIGLIREMVNKSLEIGR